MNLSSRRAALFFGLCVARPVWHEREVLTERAEGELLPNTVRQLVRPRVSTSRDNVLRVQGVDERMNHNTLRILCRLLASWPPASRSDMRGANHFLNSTSVS